MPPKQWHTKSGTLKSECPKCHDAGAIDPACTVCEGTNEVGLATAVAYILEHSDTDPPAAPGDDFKETKP